MEKIELSKKQMEYLEKLKLHKRNVMVWRIMLCILFLAIWELMARLEMIDDFIFSSPSRVFLIFISMVKDGSIFLHVGITILETIVSFGSVVSVGLVFAMVLWWSKTLFEVLEPYLVMLNSLPKSALAPMLIVWFGSNTKTIIIAAISVAIFGSILTIHNGFSGMDADKMKLIYALGGTKKDVLTKVLLPGSIPLIVANMKVNIGLCLVGVIIGEFLVAKMGLGYLIIYGSQTFKLDMVVMSIVILCFLSAGLYRGVVWLEKRFVLLR